MYIPKQATVNPNHTHLMVLGFLKASTGVKSMSHGSLFDKILLSVSTAESWVIHFQSDESSIFLFYMGMFGGRLAKASLLRLNDFSRQTGLCFAPTIYSGHRRNNLALFVNPDPGVLLSHGYL